jgi:cytochrome P450
VKDEAVRDDGSTADQQLAGMLFAPEARDDPYPLYRTVNIPGCRHAAVSAMLKDPRLGPPVLDEPASGEVMWTTFGRWMLNLDGERHQRMRQRFSRIFTPRRVEQYRPVIEARANELIDAVYESGRMELVADFARPLPFTILATVLGVPDDRRAWLADQMLVLDVGFARQHDPDAVHASSNAVGAMVDYFADLLHERAAVPEDDLMSILAADAPDDKDGRTDLLANCVFFIEAGHVSTASLITGAVALLLEHPDQLARVTGDATLAAAAVEEALRLVSPVGVVLCRAREDVDLLGYHFTQGDQRVIFPAGANRDPEVFQDPDTFDIDRTTNPHLAFSAGAHFCLGAPLARLHGAVAIQTLTRRLPSLRLAGKPVWLGSIPIRTPEHFPVAW